MWTVLFADKCGSHARPTPKPTPKPTAKPRQADDQAEATPRPTTNRARRRSRHRSRPRSRPPSRRPSRRPPRRPTPSPTPPLRAEPRRPDGQVGGNGQGGDKGNGGSPANGAPPGRVRDGGTATSAAHGPARRDPGHLGRPARDDRRRRDGALLRRLTPPCDSDARYYPTGTIEPQTAAAPPAYGGTAPDRTTPEAHMTALLDATPLRPDAGPHGAGAPAAHPRGPRPHQVATRSARRPSTRCAASPCRVAGRRVRRADGPVGQRQEHAPPAPRRPRPADHRRGHPRGRGHQPAVRRPRHAAAPRPDRLRLPVVQPDPAPRRHRERRACRSRSPARTRRAASSPSASATSSSSSTSTARSTTSPTSCRPASSSASPSRGRS